jgi:hypothetical protein
VFIINRNLFKSDAVHPVIVLFKEVYSQIDKENIGHGSSVISAAGNYLLFLF